MIIHIPNPIPIIKYTISLAIRLPTLHLSTEPGKPCDRQPCSGVRPASSRGIARIPLTLRRPRSCRGCRSRASSVEIPRGAPVRTLSHLSRNCPWAHNEAQRRPTPASELLSFRVPHAELRHLRPCLSGPP